MVSIFYYENFQILSYFCDIIFCQKRKAGHLNCAIFFNSKLHYSDIVVEITQKTELAYCYLTHPKKKNNQSCANSPIVNLELDAECSRYAREKKETHLFILLRLISSEIFSCIYSKAHLCFKYFETQVPLLLIYTFQKRKLFSRRLLQVGSL